MAAARAFHLDPITIDEIVDRLTETVVERVIEAIQADRNAREARPTRAWLDAQEVARRLGVSRDWVYEHADELGASRMGSGPRPRLRFPRQLLDFHGKERTPTEATKPPTKRRGSQPTGLIPIHGS
jgi:hypothetical protein